MKINRKGCLRLGFATMLVTVVVLVILAQGGEGMPRPARELDTLRHETTAVFGATGNVGDGLFKAAMNDPGVKKIHVVTRRPSPRIEDGVASGLVTMTTHMDYLDYSPLREILAETDPDGARSGVPL